MRNLEIMPVKLVVWGLIFLIYACLFIENLLFAESFSILPLREIDDLAFQASVRTIHESLASGNLMPFLTGKDYGYGWVFWAIHSLVTFPAYLSHLDSWVITIPRQLSLVFIVASLALFRMILDYFTEDLLTKELLLFFVATFPILAFAATRFHNHGQVLFFSMLAIYLTLKAGEKRSKRLVVGAVISASIAAATKLVGLFIAPVVFFLAIQRLGLRFDRESIKLMLQFGVLAVISTIILTFPLLMLWPFFDNEVRAYFDMMKYFLAHSRTNFRGIENEDPWVLLGNGIAGMYVAWPLLLASVGGFIFQLFRGGKSTRWQMGAVFATMVVVAIYLLLTTKQGAVSVGAYFISLGLFLPLGLLAFSMPWRKWGPFVIAGMIGIDIAANWENRHVFFLRYFARAEQIETKQLIAASQEMRRLVDPPQASEGKSFVVLMDHRAIFPYSDFDPGVRCLRFFDNLTDFKDSYDYILFHRDSAIFLPEAEIEKLGAAQAVLESKLVVGEIFSRGLYNGSRYEQIYASGKVVLFKRMRPELNSSPIPILPEAL